MSQINSFNGGITLPGNNLLSNDVKKLHLTSDNTPLGTYNPLDNQDTTIDVGKDVVYINLAGGPTEYDKVTNALSKNQLPMYKWSGGNISRDYRYSGYIADGVNGGLIYQFTSIQPSPDGSSSTIYIATINRLGQLNLFDTSSGGGGIEYIEQPLFDYESSDYVDDFYYKCVYTITENYESSEAYAFFTRIQNAYTQGKQVIVITPDYFESSTLIQVLYILTHADARDSGTEAIPNRFVFTNLDAVSVPSRRYSIDVQFTPPDMDNPNGSVKITLLLMFLPSGLARMSLGYMSSYDNSGLSNLARTTTKVRQTNHLPWFTYDIAAGLTVLYEVNMYYSGIECGPNGGGPIYRVYTGHYHSNGVNKLLVIKANTEIPSDYSVTEVPLDALPSSTSPFVYYSPSDTDSQWFTKAKQAVINGKEPIYWKLASNNQVVYYRLSTRNNVQHPEDIQSLKFSAIAPEDTDVIEYEFGSSLSVANTLKANMCQYIDAPNSLQKSVLHQYTSEILANNKIPILKLALDTYGNSTVYLYLSSYLSQGTGSPYYYHGFYDGGWHCIVADNGDDTVIGTGYLQAQPVSVTYNDNSPGYLSDKLVADEGIALHQITDDGVKKLRISAPNSGKVLVNQYDRYGMLNDKFEEGDNISIEPVVDGGGNYRLKISATGGGGSATDNQWELVEEHELTGTSTEGVTYPSFFTTQDGYDLSVRMRELGVSGSSGSRTVCIYAYGTTNPPGVIVKCQGNGLDYSENSYYLINALRGRYNNLPQTGSAEGYSVECLIVPDQMGNRVMFRFTCIHIDNYGDMGVGYSYVKVERFKGGVGGSSTPTTF